MAAAVELPKSAPLLPRAQPFLIAQDYAEYTSEHHAVWAELVRRRMPQLESSAAQEYLDGFETLCLPWDRGPNLASVSAKLERRTGWNTTPVSGFMPAPAFFEMPAAFARRGMSAKKMDCRRVPTWPGRLFQPPPVFVIIPFLFGGVPDSTLGGRAWLQARDGGWLCQNSTKVLVGNNQYALAA